MAVVYHGSFAATYLNKCLHFKPGSRVCVFIWLVSAQTLFVKLFDIITKFHCDRSFTEFVLAIAQIWQSKRVASIKTRNSFWNCTIWSIYVAYEWNFKYMFSAGHQWVAKDRKFQLRNRKKSVSFLRRILWLSRFIANLKWIAQKIRIVLSSIWRSN